MKLHLPTPLRAALMATFAAVVSLGSAAYASTTYDNLSTVDYFRTNENVYNTGSGTFYLKTEGSELNLTLMVSLDGLDAYQTVHDYANAGYNGSFVTWTYDNAGKTTYGMADVSTDYNGGNNYTGFTGLSSSSSPWLDAGGITVDTLRTYADENNVVTLTINNAPASDGVRVTALNRQGVAQTLYSATALKDSSCAPAHVTAFTVNMNYVTSVTLNTTSTLSSAGFTPPIDYTVPFVSSRTDGTSVGRIMFLGDSITHGVEDMSWRWGLFKTLVDNGIENQIAGPITNYNSKPLNSDFDGTNWDSNVSLYGGALFENRHYAQASGRTHNMLMGAKVQNALGTSTGVNYSGITSAQVGNNFNADTYVMMMGTNDIVSDLGGGANDVNTAKVFERLLGAGSVQDGTWVNAGVTTNLVGQPGTNSTGPSGSWGTMGKILDDLQMGAGDTMYIMSIPVWGHSRTDIRPAAPYVQAYNEKLELWVKAYNASHTGTVKYVDVNKGLRDLTIDGYFAPDGATFFRTSGTDYIHPNEQGALIVAGNLAKGMGLAGRTAGLHRADSTTADTTWLSGAAEYVLNAGDSVSLAQDAFNVNHGYTVDFSGVFGNGETDGWLARTNALSITVGDGNNTGTLNLSEGYISWGNTILYCQDNSAENNENIRIAYQVGDTDTNVGSGYYVWVGDMLIGQALSAGTGNLNGITLSATGAQGTISGLTYSNTAYAPTTNGLTSAENAFYVPEHLVLDTHNNTAGTSLNINFTGAGSSVSSISAVDNTTSGQNVKVTMSAADSGKTTYFAALQGSSATRTSGDVMVNVVDSTASANAFGVVNASQQTGNISMVFSNGVIVNSGRFGGGANGDGAFLGAYGGSIGGTLAVELKDATMKGNIQMGVVQGTNSIGATNLIVNAGASVTGNVLGGSIVSSGSISGDIGITVNGGRISGDIIGTGTAGSVGGNVDITITGGIIGGSVNAKDANVSMVQGKTANVTVQGNLAQIGGNISADNVTFRNVEKTNFDDSFDKFAGKVTAEDMLKLDHYTAAQVGSGVTAQRVLLTNNSATTIRNLHLTACDITAEAGSSLSLEGTLTLGNTATYSGDITVANGLILSMEASGLAASASSYSYSAGNSGFLTIGTATLLTPTDSSRLNGVNVSSLVGAGALTGATFAYNAETGILTADPAHAVSGTTYYVNDTVTYAPETEAYTAEHIVVNGTGNLQLQTGLKDGVDVASNNGVVTIGEGVTLETDSLSGNAILKGDGIYSLHAATKVLTTGITLDTEDWRGAVALSGDIGGKHVFDGLSTNNSSLLLTDVTTWITADGTVNANLILRGTGENGTGAGLTITGTNDNRTYTFNGKLSGSGDFVYSQTDARNCTFSLNGNASDWTGSFISDNKGTPKLTINPATDTAFGGGVVQRGTGTLSVTLGSHVTEVNGAILKTAGTLNMTLQGDTAFNNIVEVDTLSADGKTLTLGTHGEGENATHGKLRAANAFSVGTLRLDGGALADDCATITVSNAIYVGNGSTLKSSAVSAANTVTLSGNGTFSHTIANPSAKTDITLPLSLSADWRGTISLSGGGDKSSLRYISDETGKFFRSWTENGETKYSSVELKGMSGYLSRENTQANIILTGTEEDGTGAGLTILNGFSAQNSASTNVRRFLSSVSGKGDFVHSWSGNTPYYFTGDVSAWTGSFKTTGSGTSELWLHFNGTEGQVVNASVLHDRNSKMSLYFDAENGVMNGAVRSSSNKTIDLTATQDTTFNNTVAVHDFNAAEKTITLGTNGEGEAATHGLLSASGTANIGTLRLEGGSIADGSSVITVQNGLYIGTGSMLKTSSIAAANVVTVEGSGTLEMTSATMPTNLSLAADWTGSVVLKNVTKTDGDSYWMQNLVKADSTLEFSGFTGYDKSWAWDNNTINVRLTDTEEENPAWTFNASTDRDGFAFKNTGKWSGDGTFYANGTNKLGYTFSGDISAWTGMMKLKVGTSTVTLQDAANVVNTAILRESGNVKLTLGTGNNFTFNNSVEVDTLDAAGKSIVLGSNTKADGTTVTHGSLTVAGASSDISTLTMSSGTSATFASVANIGTLNVVDGATFTLNGGTTTLTTGLKQNSAADSARNTETGKSGSIVVNEGSVLNLSSLADNYFGVDVAYGKTNAFRFVNLVNNTTGAGTVRMKGMSIQLGGDATYSGSSLTFRTNYEFGGSLALADYKKAINNSFHWIVGSQDEAGSITVHNAAGNATLAMKNGQTLDIRTNGAVTADRLELGQAGYEGYLTMSGGSLTTGTVSSFSNSTFTATGGIIEFTVADAFAANDSLTVSLIGSSDAAPVTLKADSNSWTLNHSASIGSVRIDTTADKTITLGSTGTTTTFSATVQNGGNLVVAGTMSGSLNVTGSGQMLVQGAQLSGGTLNISNNMTGTDKAIVFDGVTIGDRVNLGGSGNMVFKNGSELTAGKTSGYSVVANTNISLEGGENGAKTTYDWAKTDLAINANKTVALQAGADLKVKGIYYSSAGSRYGNLTIDSTSSLTATGWLRMQSITNDGSVVLDKVDGEEKTVGAYSQSSTGRLELKAGVSMETAMASNGSIDGSYDLGTGASLNVKNIGSSVSVNVNDLTLSANAVMGIYKGDSVPSNPSTDTEASMVVNGTLKAGNNATLNANLVLGTNAKLDFTGENGLHMGSSLTLQSSSSIDLGETLMLAINGMVCGDSVVLFTGVDALSLGGSGYDGAQSYSAGDYFNLAGVTYADHMVVAYDGAENGGHVSLYMATPEPATSTLSLLALAALAARRKRK